MAPNRTRNEPSPARESSRRRPFLPSPRPSASPSRPRWAVRNAPQHPRTLPPGGNRRGQVETLARLPLNAPGLARDEDQGVDGVRGDVVVVEPEGQRLALRERVEVAAVQRVAGVAALATRVRHGRRAE